MSGATDRAKRDAARRAAALVEPGMAIGLGTGSTSAYMVEEIGRRLREGTLHDVRGVPSSRATAELARAAGIRLVTLEEQPVLDLVLDGADEVTADGAMLKGGGGALLREKIVAARGRRVVIMVDASKLVPRLGTRAPLPVEVVAFGWSTHLEPLRALGGRPVLRRDVSGAPYLTDDRHFILDVGFENGMADPHWLEPRVRLRPGVVETGFFLGFQPEVIVGAAD
ncbi:MAG TPA: ribose-5-phosphate isomerase RpiA [Gemmatimonadaceae bacterium]|nr:ribose-5-phosphate isomerase RpiA [Gemmatimonadaceae bacterium]